MRVLLTSAMIAVLAFVSGTTAHAQNSHVAKYAGQQTREIKSLSTDDIAELRRGGGWGLARAAELNGVPGPAHLLELKDAIELSPEQVARISEIYKTMKAKAVAEGERLISLEERLEVMFRQGTVTDSTLRAALAEIAESRKTLRYIHLSTHLETPTILSTQQIARYNVLRGYADDPCATVPKGHDPNMWRRHNGCD